MAIRTIRPLSFDDGLAYAEYDYDDATGEVLRVRASNTHTRDLWVSIRGTDDSGAARGWRWELTVPAHSGLTERRVPPGQRKRFRLEPDSGSADPYDTLGGLEVEARLV
jgi:hypothetical protein